MGDSDQDVEQLCKNPDESLEEMVQLLKVDEAPSPSSGVAGGGGGRGGVVAANDAKEGELCLDNLFAVKSVHTGPVSEKSVRGK